jgi:hypothetical protein
MAALTLQEAQRKARYGRKDWVGYRDRSGAYQAEPRTTASIKRAMLSVGTKGRFTVIEANSGVLLAMSWRIGVTMLRNAKVGC